MPIAIGPFSQGFQQKVNEKGFRVHKKGRAAHYLYHNKAFQKDGPLHWLKKGLGGLGGGLGKSLKGPMLLTLTGLGLVSAWNVARNAIVGWQTDGPLASLWEGGRTLLQSGVSMLGGLIAGGLARNIKGPIGWWLGAAAMIAGTMGVYLGLDALFAPPEKPSGARPTRTPGANPFMPLPAEPGFSEIDAAYRAMINQMGGFPTPQQ